MVKMSLNVLKIVTPQMIQRAQQNVKKINTKKITQLFQLSSLSSWICLISCWVN